MASSNPRRRSPAVTRPEGDTDDVLTLKTNMTLRKSPTFHSPASPSLSDDDFYPPRLIRRSHTNLDDVVDAHRRRMALIVDNIDKSLSLKEGSTPTSPSSRRLKVFRDNSLPVPRGLIDLPVVDPAMAKHSEPERRVLRPRHRRQSKHDASDSGLGTSIASSQEKRAHATGTSRKDAKGSANASALTRTVAASSTMENLPRLSNRAVSRIHEHTLKPLLAKPSLKDFEPIVLDVPRRIRDKEIICLRDLEKTLIFMAPERTKTPDLYLDFCLTSIRCIEATVEYLSDREQIRPRDRPYTNLYFIDLEEQIRQYAQQLATAKDKAAKGEEDMDLDPNDEVRLHGGITKNGRPAELVRVKKDGKAISMATGEPVELDEDAKSLVKMKRSMSEQLEDDEEIMRSMARRKKNPTPEELAPKKCREPGCNKEFKRPCDLTKHEKTHSRPWKCPVTTCKYHDYGWPTEKEMDRHHNDKHASTPAMFKCLYEPCPYKSKRESNCKQHMEKAHGWTYVRTKTNGKKSSSKPGSTVNETPQLRHISTPPTLGVNTPPEEHNPYLYPPLNSLEFPAPADDDELLRRAIQQPLQIEGFDDIPTGMDLSPLDDHTPSISSYDGFPRYQEEPDFITNEDLYAAHAQLPTPDQTAFAKLPGPAVFPTYQQPETCHAETARVPHFSPIGQSNVVLYTPNSLADVDEGFEDMDFAPGGGLGGDFQLYPTTGKPDTFEPLFSEVPSAGLGFSQPSQDIFATNMDWSSSDYHAYHDQH